MKTCVAAVVALAVPVVAAPAPALAETAGAAPALVAGQGAPGFAGDGGPAVRAKLNKPMTAALAADGTLYVTDTLNHRVRAVAPDGTIRTVAGNGGQTAPAGPIPAGTRGTGIALGFPGGVATGPGGTVFISDSTVSRVYALAADGSITVRADATTLGGPIATINALTVTGDGTLYLADRENNRVVELPAAAGSRPVSTPVPLPTGLAADGAGDVWISSAGFRLSRLHDGKVASIVSPSGDTWTADEARPDTQLFAVTTVSAGQDGVYVVDDQERAVRRLGTDGTVAVVADLPVEPFGARDPVTLAAAAAPGKPLYLVDMVGSRVFATPVTVAGADGGDDATTRWLLVFGGAALVVLLGVVVWVVRRRRI
ncbi:sugar lactone lactonase YvrE [Actinoplanes octamycinicus]|uniref:Sugar lactone lactonase YvrE n=1 Tax=Actinoplanes octamycinicus TaxID=135948 RepID=A0A7W7MD13_9ACTN|nr:hypothetical protein [Actinoplanes octamycinicus]MBB4745713.1 sugar lactone lactonase YvrE [Actinoplanes octamycinicus]